ncbi:MAG: glycosyltransferase family 4 protein [Acidobacteriota bacterium]
MTPGDSPQRPGVLMVGNFLSRHGANPSVGEDLAHRLRELRWDVITTSHRRLRPWRLADMVITTLRRHRRYDVAQVDVFSGPAFRWAEAVTACLRVVGKPVIFTLHGGELPAFARRHPQRVKALLRHAAAVTAPSPYLADALRPWREDLLLLPNPLELERYPFRPRGPSQKSLRPRVVWLRAFHRTYRPELAPQAIAPLVADYPELQLEMIGPDKGDGSLQATEAKARELGVQDNLRIVPGVPKSEVPQRLAAADLFLNTTDADNTPVSILEALACGLCIVSTNAGGLPKLLSDGEDALLAPVGDAEALSAALRRLLEDPGLATRLSAAGRTKVEAFDWNRVLPRWQQLLRAAAQAGPKRSLVSDSLSGDSP